MVKRENNGKNNIKNGSKNNDILRAEDIIPNSKGKDKQPHRPSEDGQPKVPKFDLADEIMAEHRKIASVKRKSPEQKIEPLRPINSSPISETTEEKQAIRDIVARDIEKLCRGESLDVGEKQSQNWV